MKRQPELQPELQPSQKENVVSNDFPPLEKKEGSRETRDKRKRERDADLRHLKEMRDRRSSLISNEAQRKQIAERNRREQERMEKDIRSREFAEMLTLRLIEGSLSLKFDLNDINNSVAYYRFELDILKEIEEDAFVIDIANIGQIPISTLKLRRPPLRTKAEYDEFTEEYKEFRDHFRNSWQEYFHVGRTWKITLLTKNDSEVWTVFQNRISDFLLPRLNPAKEINEFNNQNSSIPDGMLPFLVSTGSSGLQIYSSPIYLLSIRGNGDRFGNGFSTPVEGWLRPGKYLFGTKGSDQQNIKWHGDDAAIIPEKTYMELDI